MRYEAYSGNAQGERKLPKDSTSPKVLRLTQQARDNERELVSCLGNKEQNTGTLLQYEVSSLSLAKTTKGILVRSTFTLDILLNDRDGVRQQVNQYFTLLMKRSIDPD
ncbi:hypothetical protein MiSe_85960 [Microseira wollei NIES-4236]|uniref:Uncharacterized protein n=1 Tax=Microseira wollei NIES-4236 TaxID=2530354 RepID=A0AAV3XQC9_9CYAN|nr:hypothetical protein MiSe_85960 [Microseira wollei NIES-4236]